MKSRPSVALLIESSNAYARSLLRGIASYVREHESWSVYFTELERGQEPPASFEKWAGDGIIARIENQRIAEIIKSKNVPIVDVSAARVVEEVPWVETDDEAMAKMGFEHLRERGLTRFAFCGASQFNWSNWRANAFAKMAEKGGFEYYEYSFADANSFTEPWSADIARLNAWVESLPKPIGIMACYDAVGKLILDACRQMEISVPERVAVVGVDNDEVICEFCEPPLSSLIPDAHRAGYVAAQLLDSLMANKELSARSYLIPPLGVHARPSTDILTTQDTLVVDALKFIRDHACNGIVVEDVARAVNVSRKTLDRHFLAGIGRTPHAEISRVRIDRVKRLLVETRLPLRTIADRTGFAHVEYLSVAFKRLMGSSPAEFRRAGGNRVISLGQ